MNNRRSIVFASTIMATVLAFGSAAFACVTFMGDVEVVGDDGSTRVVGKGNAHGYCNTGRPTTAAAGHLADSIAITVRPAGCNDGGALKSHKLPAGTYETRYNNELSYNFGGTYWTMVSSTGCFLADNAGTTTTLGTFTIDSTGNGSWSGTLGTLKQAPSYATPLTASNLCIGTNGNGMLIPYQLLPI